MRRGPADPQRNGRARLAGAAAALTLAVLSACANPFIPPAGTPSTRPPIERGNDPSPFVFGNYCGYGTRKGDLSARPVNRLDAACLEHDACFIARRDRCECNAALTRAAEAILKDPRTPPKERRQARAIRSFFPVVKPICLMFPHGIMPPRRQDVLKTRYGGKDGAA